MMKRNIIFALTAVMIAAGLAVGGCGAASIYTVNEAENRVIAVVNSAADTVQDKDKTSGTEEEQNKKVYTNGIFSFSYDPEYFTTYEAGGKDGMVTVPFYKDGFEMAGSNVITITEFKDTDCKTVIQNLVELSGGNEGYKCPNYIAGDDKPGITYSPDDVIIAAGSGLKTMTTYYAVPTGTNVVLIEEFRTVGPDEETEIFIDNEMIGVLCTFELVEK